MRSRAESGNIKNFTIISHTGNQSDITGGVVEFNYYESILSNSFTATATVIDTGYKGNDDTPQRDQGLIDGLPIRGAEKCLINVEDAEGNILNFPYGININRVRNSMDTTQRDLFFLDLFSYDAVKNNLTRCMKPYQGPISDSVRTIITEDLESQMPLEVDETKQTGTNRDYNFLGNDRKPFYVLTWLAQKAVPAGAGETDKAAAFMFWQTMDKFYFRSIDKMFQESSPKKKYIYHDTEEIPPGYDDNILKFQVQSDVDVQNNMNMGMYHNRTIYFDFAAMEYYERKYNSEEQKPGVELAGLPDKFTGEVVLPEIIEKPSRKMVQILDVGTNPDGVGDEQLDKWRSSDETRRGANYDAKQRMVQSVMRYNELFTVRFDITIPGDFSLRAGDLVYVNYPLLTQDTTNPESGGIYMIASLCHRMTPSDCFTSLTLVRDSFGKKSGMNG